MMDRIIGKQGSENVAALLGSTQDLGRLSISASERLANFQIDRLRGISDMYLSELRALLEIKDATSFQEYLNSRARIPEELTRQLQEDIQALLEMSSEYSAEARKILQQKLPNNGGKVKKAA